MPSTPNHNVRDKYANYPHLTDERVKPSQEPSHTSHSDDEGRLLSDLPNHTNIEELPDAHMNQSRLGHIRAPILAREPTMLEAFSRTVRNYVPTSIPIPNAAPSPPRVSRPVSFGSFMISGSRSGNARLPADTDQSNTSQRRASRSGERAGGRGSDPRASDVFVSDDEDEVRGSGYGHVTIPEMATYPSPTHCDPILWARWDLAEVHGIMARRLLFLGYRYGMQVWDCTNLSSVSEVLNRSGQDWGHVAHAGVLPRPQLKEDDLIGGQWPAIGIMTTIEGESSSTFLVYSLYRQRVVKRLPLKGGLATFVSNDHFIVISTTYPSTLHILSASTFATLFTVPSTSLLAFNKRKTITNNNVLQSEPIPVFAFSHRLLAYTSPAPLPPSTSSQRPQAQTRLAPQPHPQSLASNTSASGVFSLGITHTELSTAAIKVGGSVLSGMKSLGGMAYEAARTSASLALGAMDTSISADVGGAVTSRGRFFSRSAPADSARNRRYSSTSPANDGYESADYSTTTVVAPRSGPSSNAGYYVTVLDLSPLLSSRSPKKPVMIAEFMASRHQPIAHLRFSGDGTSIIISPSDGQVLHLFQVRPTPMIFRGLEEDIGSRLEALVKGTRSGAQSRRDSGLRTGPYHIYDLRRGRTSAVVEGVDWTDDGRWAAIGTKKRTVHVFAINPYGGSPDVRSHMDGRVMNIMELQPLSTEVSPIVRLRIQAPPPDYPRVPLAFTFISTYDSILPTSILPPASTSHPATFVSSSLPKSESSLPSEPMSTRPTNYQDILIFDPADGILSLRRFTIELRTHDRGLSIPTPLPGLSPTSISLPGMSPSRLSASSPSGPGKSGLTRMMESPPELIGRDNVIATWSLQRHRDWGDIQQVLHDSAEEIVGRPPISGGKGDWLAQAELSTCSKSPRVLPRPIYLCHQFSFHGLGEDYHALIRRYQLDIVVTKIEVRRAVEVSAYSAGVGESFVEGFSAPRDLHRASSSFDEPLASALAGGLDYSHPPAVLPMLPNGAKPTSFRNSIPIRTMAGLSDGVTEGIGRIRREIHKVRSPSLKPRPDSTMSGPVPLEFDEEDEDFSSRIRDCDHDQDADDSPSLSTSRGEIDSGVSVSTPLLNTSPLEEGDEMWQGWGPEDNQVIEDAEQFDDISVVGFLDEEQVPTIQGEKRKAKVRGRRRGL